MFPEVLQTCFNDTNKTCREYDLLLPEVSSRSRLKPNIPSRSLHAMTLRNFLVSSLTLWQPHQTTRRALRRSEGARVAEAMWRRPDKGEGVRKVSKIRRLPSSFSSFLSPHLQLPVAREPVEVAMQPLASEAACSGPPCIVLHRPRSDPLFRFTADILLPRGNCYFPGNCSVPPKLPHKISCRF